MATEAVVGLRGSAGGDGPGGGFRDVPSGSGEGAGLGRRFQGRPAGLRSGGDVQGSDPGSAEHGERRAYGVSDPRRLSWLRFLGFDLDAATPDENTIRLFREKLTRAGAIDALFVSFDRQLRDRGYLPMGGQIVYATLVAAPKQRKTAPEKDAIKAGMSAAEICPNQPAKAAQKDTDACWTL